MVAVLWCTLDCCNLLHTQHVHVYLIIVNNFGLIMCHHCAHMRIFGSGDRVLVCCGDLLVLAAWRVCGHPQLVFVLWGVLSWRCAWCCGRLASVFTLASIGECDESMKLSGTAVLPSCLHAAHLLALTVLLLHVPPASRGAETFLQIHSSRWPGSLSQ